MNVEYIIVQAGGLGTRLKHLTRNRPKSLVPVLNKPILFHLFERYSDKKFIIIGDYRYNVLERYLRTFAEVEYILVKAEGKGNAAGIKKAIEFIPNGEPLMLIWSDLIIGEEFRLPEEQGCYIGITDRFPCSWSFRDGVMEKRKTEQHGIAGCFVFDRKDRLKDIPREGSFTSYLSLAGIPFEEMDMKDSSEVGTLEAIRKIDSVENRCRPYNHMKFTEDKVVKTGLTEEGRKLIERELQWYEAVSEHDFHGIPKIHSLSPLTMERIYGDNIFRAELTVEEKKRTIERLVDALKTLHEYGEPQINYFDLEEDYYRKTMKRVHSIREVIPFSDSQYISINGKLCRNVFFYPEQLADDIRRNLFRAEFGLIHGDCTLTNTMIDEKGNIYYIDARGYFGKTPLYGDVYYDWAKLYYSINGNFDQFNIRNFDLEIGETDVQYSIAYGGWEHLTDYFTDQIADCDIGRIKLIHSIIWLSLASHCREDYDSLCLAFYNGIYLWNEWAEEFR